MMAKEPKDRYQTPEHLVHHLYLAARKLGAAAEVPEGVLAVEAALPNPPGGRPLVLAALAAIAVVGLIFLIDSFSTPKQQSVQNPPVAASAANPSPELHDLRPGAPTQLNKTENTKPIPSVTPVADIPTFDVEKPSASDLAEFFQKNKAAPEILVKLDDLDLRDHAVDLVITNPIVRIRPRKPGQRPTIRDEYRPRLPRTFQASLTITSRVCDIENIRFVLDQTGAGVPMAMLWLRNTHEANIRGCEFIQAAACLPQKDSRMASVLVESAQPASLTLTESCFLGFRSLSQLARSGDGQQDLVFEGAMSGGQDAITRRGPVRIEPTNCLFGPHAATFRLEALPARAAWFG